MSDAPVPRTLHLLARSSGGGTETNVRALVHAVPNFEMLALEDIMGRNLSKSGIPAALRKIRSINPDVIFCYGIRAHIIAMIAYPFGKPLVGNIRCESDFSGWKGIWKKLFGWRFSDWISNSRMALRGGRGRVIYNGINPPPDEAALFPDLSHPVFGILASGSAKKGHLFALELWKKLGKPGTMIFAGNLPAAIKTVAEREGVLCPGYVNAGGLLRSLDLLLIPSTAEGIPTVLLEALARGIPVLATPVGGITEIISHGKSGLVLPREEWEAFLTNIDWEFVRKTGDAGRDFILANYSFDKMRDEFISASQRAVGE
ncbi:hypothetical protein BH09SUM1_BH09SUM1_17500 [soil metagenome]